MTRFVTIHAPPAAGAIAPGGLRLTSVAALVAAFVAAVVLASISSNVAAQTVVDILPATDGAWGLDYHDGALWQGDDHDGFIYKIDPVDGAILDTIPTPFDRTRLTAGANHGVAWDDSTIWVAGDYGKGWLYRLDPSGTTVDSIPAPAEAVGGLAWADSLLLVTTYDPDGDAGVSRIDPADGSSVGGTISVSGNQPYGIVYDAVDSTMWSGIDDHDGDAETIDQFTFPGATQVSQFLSPGDAPKGIAIGGGYLWLVADAPGGDERHIYKIDIGRAGTGDIALEPESYDFGVVAIGDTATYVQHILNEGLADLEVTFVLVLDPFSVETETLPVILAPGDTLSATVSYSPTVIGSAQRLLTIASSDGEAPSIAVPVTGLGVAPVPLLVADAADISIPDTAIGLVRDGALSFQNLGAEPLIVSSISIDDPAFSLLLQADLPDTLAAAESRSLQVLFRPTDFVPHVGLLALESNDPTHPTVTRAVTGAGIDKSFAGGEVIWSAPGIDDIVNTIAIPDIDGDGISDAVMESYDPGADGGDPHRAYFGNSDENGVIEWSTGEGAAGGYGDQALALLDDVDDDGFPEIVRGVSGDGRRVELRESESGETLWTFDSTPFDGGGWVYSVAVLPDVTADGIDDVVAAFGTNGGVETGARRVVGLNGADGTPVWSLIGSDGFLSVATGDDVNGDTISDVVAGGGGNGADTHVYCIDGASVGTADVLWTFDTGGSVWSVSFISDVTGDGINDVIAGSWSQNVYCLSGVDGDPVWTAPIGGSVVGVEVVDDVNGDTVPDVAVANLSSTFRMVSGDSGLPLWVLGTGSSTWSTSAIPDVSGDGIVDIVLGSQGEDIFCAEGTTGTVLWQASLGGLVHVVRPISDVNGNGFGDVLAGTQRLGGAGGTLFCIEGGTTVVDVVDEDPATLPTGIAFAGLSANPMPGRGAFRFDVRGAGGSTVEVSIFDAGGRHVRSLVQRLDSGTSSLPWDGQDASGRRVPSGAYFFRIRGLEREGAPVHALTGKITVIQ